MRRKNELDPEKKSPQMIEHNLSFEEAVELFIKEQLILNRAPRTITWHQENFHVFKKAFREQSIPLEIKTITEKQIKHNFILYCMETFKSQSSTVNNRMQTLKSFWKYLKKRRLC